MNYYNYFTQIYLDSFSTLMPLSLQFEFLYLGVRTESKIHLFQRTGLEIQVVSSVIVSLLLPVYRFSGSKSLNFYLYLIGTSLGHWLQIL